MFSAITSGLQALGSAYLPQIADMGGKALVGYVGQRLGELGGDSTAPQTLGSGPQQSVDTLGNNIDLQRRVRKLERTVRNIVRRSPSRRAAPVIQEQFVMPERPSMNDNELGFE